MSKPLRICPKCKNIVPDGHLYCGICGHKCEEHQRRLPPPQPYLTDPDIYREAALWVVRGQAQGEKKHLQGERMVVGKRADWNLKDPFVEEQHAAFYFEKDGLYLQNLSQINGVYRKIRCEQLLEDGDMFIAGEHVFRFERLEEAREFKDASGTLLYVSPPSHKGFRIVEILKGGLEGQSYASPYDVICVGRSGCDMSFFEDPFMDLRHFKIMVRNQKFYLRDLNTLNGTFVKIRSSVRLTGGDDLILGQHMLRVCVKY